MRNRYLSVLMATALGMSSTASMAAVCASGVTAAGADAGLAYSADGQVHIFYALTNGNLARRFGNPLSPNDLTFENLGGIAGSEPSATSWGPGHVATFLRGSNGELYYLQWNNGSTTGWQSLGGQVIGNPSGVATNAGNISVFYRGTDQQLYNVEYSLDTWGEHQSLNGSLTSNPVAVSWGPSHVAVFTRGQQNDLWYRDRTRWTWGPWIGLGGNFSVDPVVVSRGPGLLDVFVRGDDNTIYYKAYNFGTWSAEWIPLGAPSGVFNGISEPGAVATPNGEVTVFARGMVLQGHNGNPDTIGVFRRSSSDGVNWSPWATVQVLGGLNIGATAGNPEAAPAGYNSWTVVSPTGNGSVPITLCTGP